MRVIEEVEKNKEQTTYMLQQSRLAQMGEMISMIAHQWRQPLTVISMSSNNMKMNIALEEIDLDEFDKHLNEISDQTNYLSNTIEDFRNFFKPEKEKELASITIPITRALQIAETSMHNKEITIDTNFETEEKLNLYQNEMLQVILNILKTV